MRVDLSAQAVLQRLQQVSVLAGSLRPEHRLETKIDMSAQGVARRLREVSELLQLCGTLRQAGRDQARGRE